PLLGLGARRIEGQRFNFGLKVYQTRARENGEEDEEENEEEKKEEDGKEEDRDEGDGRPSFIAINKDWIAVSSDLKLLEKTINLQIEDPEERTRLQFTKDATPLARDAAFRKMAA
ncbi:MAG: hypothetical protein GWO24_08775, partial [Akkermansiaceae bacterium]|nr:hypothetical protein [Akkermansiaceae bacterium]